MALRIEVRGVAEARASLADLVERLDSLEDLWAMYAGIMVMTEEEWFASEGGGTWPPLAPETVAEKLRLGFGPEPLIRTSDLFESLIDPAQAMEIGQGRSTLGTFTRNAMTWGTSVEDDRGREYAHYHQGTDPVTGEPASYGTHPPERQVIPWPLPAATIAQMEVANEEFVAEAIRSSGL